MNRHVKKSVFVVLLVCLTLGVLMVSPGWSNSRPSWIVVIVDDVKYKPAFSAADYADYKGKSLYLPSVINRANNTRSWYYYSAMGRITYEGTRPLESYFWYCLQKAIQSVGIKVYEYNPPKDVPEFRFEFYSLTDEDIIFKVDLVKAGMILFQHPFMVKVAPPKEAEPVLLEKRAYEMIDEIITTVLKDQNFKKALK